MNTTDDSDPTLLAGEEAGPQEVYAGGRPRLGPALIVVGLALLLTVVGALFAVFASGGNGPAPKGSGNVVSGTGLHPVAATRALSAISADGEPPGDIARALVVPSSAKETHFSASLGGGVDLYDASVTLSVPAGPGEVVSFFSAELRRLGWGNRSQSPTAGSGTELIARRASSDGYYWEVGVTVKPASASVSPALGGGPLATASSVSIRLFEVADIE